MSDIVYADQPETILYEHPNEKSSPRNHVLLGTWLRVLERQNKWLKVEPRPNRGDGGWVPKNEVRNDPGLKIFFVDVGQGDGAIIESAKGIIVIDGGPNTNFYRFMRHRYKPIIQEQGHVHIDAVVVSHPDDDHFHGITRLIEDDDFTFGTIYHNGIIRYSGNAGKELDLGIFHNRTISGTDVRVLTETFNSIEDAGELVDNGHLMSRFNDFWLAAWNAHVDGRLATVRRITNRDKTLSGYSGTQSTLRIEVLGPVPTQRSGRVEYVGFPPPENPKGQVSKSHTINGHSIVLKLIYGKHSFLFSGDLNIPAEKHLLAHYGSKNPFRVNIAKACHHGSSDFSVAFLKKVLPQVNVFSSGEERGHDHPMPDALGAAGHHTRGSLPLLFSTELARTAGGSRTHYGLINARSNGTVLTMAQMKERRTARTRDVWNSFTVPWKGRFHKESS